MTRIDLHPAHAQPTPARTAGKPDAHHPESKDFLEHVRAGTPAMPDQERQPDRRMPTPMSARFGQVAPGSDPGIGPSQAPWQEPGRLAASIPLVDAISPAPAEPNLALQVAHHAPVVAEEGIRARVFEQHWFANGYLSFIDAADSRMAGPGGRAVVAGAGCAPVVEAPGPVPSSSLTSQEGVDAESGMPWPVMIEGSDRAITAPESSVQRLARVLGPLISAGQPWPERLLRLSQKPGGKATMWVRDYGLVPQAIDPLVAHLRRVAAGEGIELERVMVNGVVAWRADSRGES
ncbi:hypothetical protein [Fulvimonas yonginensis]|uniref:Toxin co-regulated pilus biosynthesis protein Q C-terminal domain-containing protein n=1 Tax=Fulvimonas yonginensis TaxID=1495200 RepID=A0ABU8JD14_9GAMM